MCSLVSQAASMEQRHTADGGSVMRTQKHDNRINKDLLVRGSSDMAGDGKKRETDDKTITASSTPSGTKSSSPAHQRLKNTSSIEKFVYETDKSAAVVVVQVDSVSQSVVNIMNVYVCSCLHINIAIKQIKLKLYSEQRDPRQGPQKVLVVTVKFGL